jgi:CBS domain-containing protein
MDGGRVLRALLSMKMGRVRATDVAARIGKWTALAFGLLGLFGSPMLVFIAFFVWIGAGEEAALVHMSAALESMRVQDAMVTDFESLPANAPIAYGAERAVRSVQQFFPVVDDWRLVGVVSSAELVHAMAEGHGHALVTSIARPLHEIVTPADPVEGALARLETADEGILPVVQADRLVGLLVPRKVVELAGLREAARANG